MIKAEANSSQDTIRLIKAVGQSDLEELKLLLRQGVWFDQPIDEAAAVLVSIEESSPNILRTLLDAGASLPDVALFHALKYDKSTAIIDMLIPLASREVLNNSVYPAIVCRVSCPMVRRLIEAGASVDDPSLVTMATATHIPYLELLLQYGADPFVESARYAYPSRVRLLQKAQSNKLNEKRRTQIACFIACYRPAAYQGTIPDELVHSLAPLVWPQGCGGIRRRVVAYLVDTYMDRIHYNDLRHVLFMQGI
jgi:hypothetical protein